MMYHKIAHFVIAVSCIIIFPVRLKAGDAISSSSSSSSSALSSSSADIHQLRELGEKVLKNVNLWGSFVYFAFQGLQEAQKNIAEYKRDVEDNNGCWVALTATMRNLAERTQKCELENEKRKLNKSMKKAYELPVSVASRVGDWVATIGIFAGVLSVAAVSLPTIAPAVAVTFAGLGWWGDRISDRYKIMKEHNEKVNRKIQNILTMNSAQAGFLKVLKMVCFDDGMKEDIQVTIDADASVASWGEKYKIPQPQVEAFKRGIYDFACCTGSIIVVAGSCVGFAFGLGCYAKMKNQFSFSAK
jgi:hypothetical protein